MSTTTDTMTSADPGDHSAWDLGVALKTLQRKLLSLRSIRIPDERINALHDELRSLGCNELWFLATNDFVLHSDDYWRYQGKPRVLGIDAFFVRKDAQMSEHFASVLDNYVRRRMQDAYQRGIAVGTKQVELSKDGHLSSRTDRGGNAQTDQSGDDNGWSLTREYAHLKVDHAALKISNEALQEALTSLKADNARRMGIQRVTEEENTTLRLQIERLQNEKALLQNEIDLLHDEFEIRQDEEALASFENPQQGHSSTDLSTVDEKHVVVDGDVKKHRPTEENDRFATMEAD